MGKGEGKKVLITGGTSGLGLELVRYFLKSGAEVWAAGRRETDSHGNSQKYHFIKADFTDLRQVSGIFGSMAPGDLGYDIVINNAGILPPPVFTETGNGFEYALQVNLLAHLVLNEIIVERMDKGRKLFIVSVTSPVAKYIRPGFRMMERDSYRPLRVYAESKFFLLLMGSFMKMEYPEKNIKAAGLDPGTFSSGIYRTQKGYFRALYHIAAPFMRKPGKIARNCADLVLDENLRTDYVYLSSGRFYEMPGFGAREKDFLLACKRAVNIMR
jgi:NAD(P)-dependent dehydrogenase (short-subunit alcohol dehydrogenase family)